jgi:hypothetical protein
MFTAVFTGGVHSEQNMLRVANVVPSLLRTCFAGCIGDGIAGCTRGVLLESPRNFASMTWLVAFAANTEHTSTTAAPSTQK